MNTLSTLVSEDNSRHLASATRPINWFLGAILGTISIELILYFTVLQWSRTVGRLTSNPVWAVVLLALLGGLVAVFVGSHRVPAAASVGVGLLLGAQTIPVIFSWSSIELPDFIVRIASESVTYAVVGVLLVGGILRWFAARTPSTSRSR